MAVKRFLDDAQLAKDTLYYGNLVAAIRLGIFGEGKQLLNNIENYKKKHQKELVGDPPKIRR